MELGTDLRDSRLSKIGAHLSCSALKGCSKSLRAMLGFNSNAGSVVNGLDLRAGFSCLRSAAKNEAGLHERNNCKAKSERP